MMPCSDLQIPTLDPANRPAPCPAMVRISGCDLRLRGDLRRPPAGAAGATGVTEPRPRAPGRDEATGNAQAIIPAPAESAHVSPGFAAFYFYNIFLHFYFSATRKMKAW
jgi:hypothetical protein